MNTRSKISLFLIAFIITVTAFASPCIALVINVHSNSTIKGETIYLGDIATFKPSNDKRVKKLKKIEISVAPAPNTFSRINRDLLVYKISPFTSGEHDISMNAPENITVYRSGQIVNSETIEKIYRDYVMAHSPWARGKISIVRINTPGDITLPHGKLSWDVEERQDNNFTGNVSLLIDFIVNGVSARKIITSGQISISRNVVKAARDINFGQIISKDDIIVVTENKSYFPKDAISSPKDAIGKRATRRIQANQTIDARMVEYPPMINKGDRVIIKAENNLICVTATGEALEEGSLGKEIRVKNINSGKELIAKVIKPDLVEVNF